MWIALNGSSPSRPRVDTANTPGSEGRWCAAILRLTDTRVEETEDEITRYPAQWVYMMWKPAGARAPVVWPNGWGLGQDDPCDLIKAAAGTAGWYELDGQHCAWSLWLDLLLNCGTWDAWQLDLLRRRRDEERQAERSRQLRLYSDQDPTFDEFLQQMTRTDVVDPDSTTEVIRLRDGMGAEQSRVTVAMSADGNMLLRFEPLDFGAPRLPDVEYRLDADAVALAKLELALLGGEVFDDAAGFVRVLQAQFDDLRQGLRWLREAGIWRRHSDSA